MSSRHHERIRRLATWMRQREDMRMPLIVYHHAETLARSSAEEIEAARAEGRTIVNVRFVKPKGGVRPDSGPETAENGANGSGARNSEV